MIQTLRDAEIQIEALKRQQLELIRELRALQNGNSITPPKVAPVKSETIVIQNNEIDNVLTADKNTVLHKLLHIFNELQAQVINVETLNVADLFAEILNLKSLDIRDNVESQIHISALTGEKGTYITDVNQGSFWGSFYSNGASFDGTDWIAKDTIAIILEVNPNFGVRVFRNTGLTVDTSFTPTQIMQINEIGKIFSKGIDIRTPTYKDQFHISNDATEQGTYIMNLGNITFINQGAYFNGSAWIASNTTATILSTDAGGGIVYYLNTGLTVGAAFTPVQIFRVNAAGKIINAGIDIKTPTYKDQLHISNDATEQGAYMMNVGNTTYLISGAYHNGTDFIAVNTTAIMIALTAAGYRFFYNPGLTLGQVITFTSVMQLNSTGISQLIAPLTVDKGGTGQTTLNSGYPLLGNGTGAIGTPASVFNGVIYVAASSGGPVTNALTVTNGIIR